MQGKTLSNNYIDRRLKMGSNLYVVKRLLCNSTSGNYSLITRFESEKTIVLQ